MRLLECFCIKTQQFLCEDQLNHLKTLCVLIFRLHIRCGENIELEFVHKAKHHLMEELESNKTQSLNGRQDI